MPGEPPIWPGQVGGSKGSQPLAKAKQEFTNLYPASGSAQERRFAPRACCVA
jgi:hypothetical protein